MVNETTNGAERDYPTAHNILITSASNCSGKYIATDYCPCGTGYSTCVPTDIFTTDIDYILTTDGNNIAWLFSIELSDVQRNIVNPP